MANRQSAPAGIRADVPEDTARVVMHKSALPGWFWGMLGCLTVLGVGFGALIVVARSGLLGGGPVGPATAAAATVAAPPPPPPATGSTGSVGSRPQPQIEQLVPPPAAPLVPTAEPKARTQPHAIKLARSPSGGHSAAADKPAADKAAGDDKSGAATGEAAATKKPVDKAAGDDDQVVRHHKTAASDEDDDEDE